MTITKEQRKELISETLKIASGVAQLSLLALLPGLAKALGSRGQYLNDSEGKRELRKTLQYMKRKDLISVGETYGDNFIIEITSDGKKRASKINFVEMELKRQKSWDRKWRLIIFDIPESKRNARMALTNKLNALGCYQLQRSIWAFPYPCFEEIELIKQVFGVDPYVNLITAELDPNSHNRLVRYFRNRGTID